MLSLLDGMNVLFRFLAGLGSGDTDLVSSFIKNDAISSAWIYIVIISLASLAILTVVALIKTMSDPKRRQTKIIGTFFGAVLSMFITQAVVFGGIAVSNVLLKTVDNATTFEYNMTFSQRIMKLCVAESGWRDGYGPEDFNPNSLALDVFGFYISTPAGFEIAPNTTIEKEGEDGSIEYFLHGETYLGGGIVDLYKTNIFLLFIVSLILVIIIASMLLKLTRRIFDVILLYLVMPFTISSMPLDDGERFKSWRENLTGKILSIYGTVISFNVFNMFGTALESLTAAGENSSANTILSFLLIIGGVFSAAGASTLFSSVIGLGKTQNVKASVNSNNGGGVSAITQMRDSIRSVAHKKQQTAIANGTSVTQGGMNASTLSSAGKFAAGLSNVTTGLARYAGLKVMAKLTDKSLKYALKGGANTSSGYASNSSNQTQNKESAQKSLALPEKNTPSGSVDSNKKD